MILLRGWCPGWEQSRSGRDVVLTGRHVLSSPVRSRKSGQLSGLGGTGRSLPRRDLEVSVGTTCEGNS